MIFQANPLGQSNQEFGFSSNQQKYFMFFKLLENPSKKSSTPYTEAIAQLSHEDKIIQKNLKFLLNQCENLESLEFAIRNKNNALDIFGVIE